PTFKGEGKTTRRLPASVRGSITSPPSDRFVDLGLRSRTRSREEAEEVEQVERPGSAELRAASPAGFAWHVSATWGRLHANARGPIPLAARLLARALRLMDQVWSVGGRGRRLRQ